MPAIVLSGGDTEINQIPSLLGGSHGLGGLAMLSGCAAPLNILPMFGGISAFPLQKPETYSPSIPCTQA